MPGLVSFSILRCFAQPVRKFAHEEINLLLCAASCISVTLFQKHDEMIPLSTDAVEIIWCEVFPPIVEFASKLLPSGLQNIVIHSCYLSLIFLFVTMRSCVAVNGSATVLEKVRFGIGEDQNERMSLRSGNRNCRR